MFILIYWHWFQRQHKSTWHFHHDGWVISAFTQQNCSTKLYLWKKKETFAIWCFHTNVAIANGHLESSHRKDISLFSSSKLRSEVGRLTMTLSAVFSTACGSFLPVSSRLCHMVAFAKCHQLHRNRRKNLLDSAWSLKWTDAGIQSRHRRFICHESSFAWFKTEIVWFFYYKKCTTLILTMVANALIYCECSFY